MAWTLMSNHIHLLIRTGQNPLSSLMRSLLTGYAVYFNRKYKRSGHLFQNRYKAVMCQEDMYLLELVRYLHLNPLRARIISTAEELNNYSWTGHSAIMGNKKREWQNIDEVLRYFSKTEKEGKKRYFEFINDGISMGHRDELAGGGGLKRSAGGWEGLLELKRNKTKWLGDERILGDGDFVNEVLKLAEEKIEKAEKLKKDGWTLERIAKEVCEFLSIERESLFKKGRNNNISRAKGMFCYYGYNDLGVKCKELSDYLKISQPAVTKSIARGEEYIKRNNIKLLN